MKIIKGQTDKDFYIEDGNYALATIKTQCTLCGDNEFCLEIGEVHPYHLCTSCLRHLSGFLSVINDKN